MSLAELGEFVPVEIALLCFSIRLVVYVRTKFREAA
jgi:hypothetical protein